MLLLLLLLLFLSIITVVVVVVVVVVIIVSIHLFHRTISVDDFLSILKSLDPSQPEKKMAQLLRYIFRISDKSVDSISGTQTDSVQSVLSRINQSAIMRNSS